RVDESHLPRVDHFDQAGVSNAHVQHRLDGIEPNRIRLPRDPDPCQLLAGSAVEANDIGTVAGYESQVLPAVEIEAMRPSRRYAPRVRDFCGLRTDHRDYCGLPDVHQEAIAMLVVYRRARATGELAAGDHPLGAGRHQADRVAAHVS